MFVHPQISTESRLHQGADCEPVVVFRGKSKAQCELEGSKVLLMTLNAKADEPSELTTSVCYNPSMH